MDSRKEPETGRKTETIRRIQRLVDAVMNSYEEGKFIDRVNTFRQPEEAEILRVLSELRQVVFQGFFANTEYKVYTQRNHLTMMMEDIIFRLSRQIALVLPYDTEKYKGKTQQEISSLAMELTLKFMERIPWIRRVIETDVEAAFDGDPAAYNRDEIIFSYPGLYAIFTNRVAHELYLMDVPLIPRIMTEHAHRETGIDINPGATIGEYFFIDHGTGIVIGETTEIGNHVKVYQGVTLGALSTRGGRALNNVKRHPTIEDDVTIYSGASILGGETVIGKGSVVGGNTFITRSIPAGTRVSVKNQELVLVGGKTEVRELSETEDAGLYEI